MSKIIAVSVSDLNEWGCPYCGYQSGYTHVSCGGSSDWNCGECGMLCCVLADGVKKSRIGFGEYYPELQTHPMKGIPKHGNPDKKPETGGEFFSPRGLGSDHTPGCFVCGGEPGLQSNIAAFVRCKESGERVVEMFSYGAYLDYRDYEPDRVQVKVGACKTHFNNLRKLHEITMDGIITSEKIEETRR